MKVAVGKRSAQPKVTAQPVTEIERLRALANSLYNSILTSLPDGHNHCRETACIISSLASAMRVEHRRCAGVMRLASGDCTPHSWVQIADTVIHSPARGRVEMADPGPFEAEFDYLLTARPGD